MSAEIAFPNLNQLQAAIAALPRLLQQALADVGPRALLIVAADLADYPAAPAGSTYQRTGTLGRLWTGAQPVWSNTTGLGFTGTLANATPYGPYVQDAQQQAPWMDYWKTNQEALDAHLAEIAALLSDALAQPLQDIRT